MSKTYTILVIRDSEQPVICYTQDMGELPAVTIDTLTGQRRTIGLTMTHYMHTLLVTSTDPGLYYRVKQSSNGSLICSCKTPGCEHVKQHPMYAAS